MSSCGCFATHCEIQTRHCPACRADRPHHIFDGSLQPVTYYECLDCGDIREILYMTDAEILAETQRGF